MAEIHDIKEPSNGSRHKGLKIIAECNRTGEPVFVFRAKDILSVMVLAEYIELLGKFLPNDHEFHEQVIDLHREFLIWQREHMDMVRYPD